MKRMFILLIISVLTVSFASISAGAEMKQGTIKGIDAENRTILFCPKGTEDHISMEVADTVNLSKFKEEMKVKVFLEEKGGKKIVKGMKPDKRIVQGC